MQVFQKRCHCAPVRRLAWQSVPPVQTDFTEVLRNLQPLGYGLPEGELPRRGKRSHPGVRRFAPRNDSAGRNPVIKIRVLTKTDSHNPNLQSRIASHLQNTAVVSAQARPHHFETATDRTIGSVQKRTLFLELHKEVHEIRIPDHVKGE